METSTENSLCNVIQKFRTDFADTIPFQLYLKLYVLQYRLIGNTTSKIKNELVNLQKNFDKSSEEWFKIDLYLTKDCKKLNRIHTCNTAIELIKLIQMKTLCTCIIQKYPSPMLVGFPYEYWTASRLRKYICSYFSVKKKEVCQKTLANILNTQEIREISKYPASLKALENLNSANFYYLYLKFDKFKTHKTDTPNSSTKYNRHVFAALFELSGETFDFIDKKHNMYFYNVKKKSSSIPSLYEILNQFFKKPDRDNSKPTIIYINSQRLNIFKNRSYKRLTTLPEYGLFFYDSINKKSLDELSNNSDVKRHSIAIADLKELATQLDAIPFKVPSEKKIFLGKMLEKIYEHCGDYR